MLFSFGFPSLSSFPHRTYEGTSMGIGKGVNLRIGQFAQTDQVKPPRTKKCSKDYDNVEFLTEFGG